jgi:hypothetical protein
LPGWQSFVFKVTRCGETVLGCVSGTLGQSGLHAPQFLDAKRLISLFSGFHFPAPWNVINFEIAPSFQMSLWIWTCKTKSLLAIILAGDVALPLSICTFNSLNFSKCSGWNSGLINGSCGRWLCASCAGWRRC